MRPLLPRPFGKREWRLSFLALALAIPPWIGMATIAFFGYTVFLYAPLCSLVFIIAGRRNRCFFTALFNTLCWVGICIEIAAYQVFFEGKSLSFEHFFALAWIICFLVFPSVGVAWLVNRCVKSIYDPRPSSSLAVPPQY